MLMTRLASIAKSLKLQNDTSNEVCTNTKESLDDIDKEMFEPLSSMQDLNADNVIVWETPFEVRMALDSSGLHPTLMNAIRITQVS